MAYKQSPINFGEGTGSSPLSKGLKPGKGRLKEYSSHREGEHGKKHDRLQRRSKHLIVKSDDKYDPSNTKKSDRLWKKSRKLAGKAKAIREKNKVDKNWTGKEKSGSKAETKAFKKDRNEALKKGKFKKALNIQKDVKSSKAANKKFLDDQHEEPVRRRDLDKKGKKIYDDHNKHAKKTEGSKLRQGLRRRFGSNKPK